MSQYSQSEKDMWDELNRSPAYGDVPATDPGPSQRTENDMTTRPGTRPLVPGIESVSEMALEIIRLRQEIATLTQERDATISHDEARIAELPDKHHYRKIYLKGHNEDRPADSIWRVVCAVREENRGPVPGTPAEIPIPREDNDDERKP